jgi:hypothetical protein
MSDCLIAQAFSLGNDLQAFGRRSERPEGLIEKFMIAGFPGLKAWASEQSPLYVSPSMPMRWPSTPEGLG